MHKEIKRGATYWRCSVRCKSMICKVQVTERDGTFTRKAPHIHPEELGALLKAQIAMQVKAKAQDEVKLW